jgi:hypothetical protein
MNDPVSSQDVELRDLPDKSKPLESDDVALSRLGKKSVLKVRELFPKWWTSVTWLTSTRRGDLPFSPF